MTRPKAIPTERRKVVRSKSARGGTIIRFVPPGPLSPPENRGRAPACGDELMRHTQGGTGALQAVGMLEELWSRRYLRQAA